MLRRQISSDIESLNELHKKYWWIPEETMIRPSQNVLDDKREFSSYVLHNWMSFKDFILATHFKYPYDVEDGQMYVLDINKKKEWHFAKSLFPYDIPNNVHHYILWNSFYDYFHELEEHTINAIITETLESMCDSDDFDFVWYINPKPSIPELWHCQVFWVKL
jgi:hypothetical protein